MDESIGKLVSSACVRSVRFNTSKKREPTLVFGAEPGTTDPEFDEVGTALEDVREASFREKRRTPEGELLE